MIFNTINSLVINIQEDANRFSSYKLIAKLLHVSDRGVRVGDEVAGRLRPGRRHYPTRAYVHEQVETLVVTLEDGGTVETTTGPSSPETVAGPPQGLRPGDLLHSPDGTWATVTNFEATGHTRTVYNLEIEDLHTYHVRAGTTWTTVHNTCPRQVDYGSTDLSKAVQEGTVRLRV